MDINTALMKIDHGFTIRNPFSTHNFNLVLDSIGRDSARNTALGCRKLKRKFSGYSTINYSAQAFCSHMFKVAVIYGHQYKPEQLKQMIGNDNCELGWFHHGPTGTVIVYAEYLADDDKLDNFRCGLLLQWRNYLLESAEYVEFGTRQRNSIFDTKSFITKNMLYYSLLKVSREVSRHLDQNAIGGLADLIVNEICHRSGWDSAIDLLKSHADHSEVEQMFSECMREERKQYEEQIDPDSIADLGRLITRYVSYVIEHSQTRYIFENDYVQLSTEATPDCVIVYGTGSCLYYGYRPSGQNEHYYLKIDDLKRVTAFLRGVPNIPFKDLDLLSAVDVIEIVETM